MKKIFITLLTALLVAEVSAQELEKAPPKVHFEVLFNVSDVLARSLGNTNSSTFITDPIMVGAKIKKPSSDVAIRVGTNFLFITGDEIFSSFQRLSKEEFYSISAGIERRKNIGRKIQYYYGVDARYSNMKTETVSFFSSSQDEFHAIQNGPGVSPLLGFKWQITDRFSLFTEASLSVDLINNYRYIQNSNGQKIVLEDKLETVVKPTAPGAIFLSFRL